jgi:tetratricopeptide (TPR) repeat protein
MLLAVALMQVALSETAPIQTRADADYQQRQQVRFESCLQKIDENPADAYETAMAWFHEGSPPLAMRCAGMALIETGRVEEGADRLASLAASNLGGSPETRVGILVQAANAYLIARLPEKAKPALDRAIGLVSKDDPGLPDLLIDRARVFAMLANYRLSEEDLSSALDKRPDDALALRLRAAARMRQSAFDLAVKDAEDAVRFTPSKINGADNPEMIEALLVRGEALEAQRTGRAPE